MAANSDAAAPIKLAWRSGPEVRDGLRGEFLACFMVSKWSLTVKVTMADSMRASDRLIKKKEDG